MPNFAKKIANSVSTGLFGINVFPSSKSAQRKENINKSVVGERSRASQTLHANAFLAGYEFPSEMKMSPFIGSNGKLGQEYGYDNKSPIKFEPGNFPPLAPADAKNQSQPSAQNVPQPQNFDVSYPPVQGSGGNIIGGQSNYFSPNGDWPSQMPGQSPPGIYPPTAQMRVHQANPPHSPVGRSSQPLPLKSQSAGQLNFFIPSKNTAETIFANQEFGKQSDGSYFFPKRQVGGS